MNHSLLQICKPLYLDFMYSMSSQQIRCHSLVPISVLLLCLCKSQKLHFQHTRWHRHDAKAQAAKATINHSDPFSHAVLSFVKFTDILSADLSTPLLGSEAAAPAAIANSLWADICTLCRHPVFLYSSLGYCPVQGAFGVYSYFGPQVGCWCWRLLLYCQECWSSHCLLLQI